MSVGKEGKLSISFLGSFAEYPYDGKGSNGVGSLGPIVDGRAPVEFSQFRIPHLQLLPGLDVVRVEVEPHSLSGWIDFCTGQIELDFDSTFTSIPSIVEPAGITGKSKFEYPCKSSSFTEVAYESSLVNALLGVVH